MSVQSKTQQHINNSSYEQSRVCAHINPNGLKHFAKTFHNKSFKHLLMARLIVMSLLHELGNAILLLPINWHLFASFQFKRYIIMCFLLQSKLPIRSPLFSVTLQSAVSSGSPRTISNANAPLFSTHLSNAVNGQQKLSQIAKFSL